MHKNEPKIQLNPQIQYPEMFFWLQESEVLPVKFQNSVDRNVIG